MQSSVLPGETSDEVDFETPRVRSQHNRSCCVSNGVDPNGYTYEGKPPTVAAVAAYANKEPATKDPVNTNISEDKENADPNVEMSFQNMSFDNVDSPQRPLDVSEDMKATTNRLATESLTLQPNKIWL